MTTTHPDITEVWYCTDVPFEMQRAFSSEVKKLRPHSHYTGFIVYRITSYIR